MKKGQDQRSAETHEKCLKLRLTGMSYSDIGRVCGVSKQAAHQHVHQELKKIAAQSKELAENYRDIEIERLDRIFEEIWKKVEEGDIQAMNQAHKNIEIRCKLLGLNSPTEFNIKTNDPESILIRMQRNATATD